MSLNLRHLPRMFFRLSAIMGVLVVAFALGGCSAVRLGYNNGPSLGYWWLDRYFDFNTAQTTQMRTDLQALQTWHRAEELPLLAEMLKNLQPAATAPVDADQVCTLAAFLQTRLRVVGDHFTDALVRLAPTLTPAQLEHIRQEFDKRNATWREEWMDVEPGELTTRRVKLLVERAESFYGTLEPAQREQLRQQMTTSAYDPNLNYRESLRRQQDALQTLRDARNTTATESSNRTALRGLVERFMESPDATHRQYVEKVRLQTCSALAALHNSTTVRQRQKLAKTLQDYEADVRALMRN